MTRVAILARAEDASPKVLAQSLHHMLGRLGIESKIFLGVNGLLFRLLPLWQQPRRWYQYPHRRLQAKLAHRVEDRRLVAELRSYSAVVLCETIPNAFWRNYYDVESLRRHLRDVPLLLHEVYYLGNAPSMQSMLRRNGDSGLERFDWHLSVSEVTEIRSSPEPPWSAIGLDLTHTNLRPAQRDRFFAVVDFAQPGYEQSRQVQLDVLRDLGVETVILSERRAMADIRCTYQSASALFIQSPEAFGVPIAECLYSGSYVFTPDSAWPMAFRLDAAPQINGPGRLPPVFKVYRDAVDLRRQVEALRAAYDPVRDPLRVAEEFRATYPTFCDGNLDALRDVVRRIEHGELKSRAS